MRVALLAVLAIGCSKQTDEPPAAPAPRDAMAAVDAAPIKALANWPLGTTPAWQALAKRLPIGLLTGVLLTVDSHVASCRPTAAGGFACTTSPIAVAGRHISGSDPAWPAETVELLSPAEAAAFDRAPSPTLEEDLDERIATLRPRLRGTPTPLLPICDLHDRDGSAATSCDLPMPYVLTAWLGHGVFAVAEGRTYRGALFTDTINRACPGPHRARIFIDARRTIVAGLVELDASCAPQPRAVELKPHRYSETH
jgi:hypothetical protein